MKIVRPDFWNDFKCIADKCPATCCSGWQIMIDDDSLEKYDEHNGPLYNDLQEKVDWEEGCFCQRDNRDCAFLNETGLCDMITIGGEEMLCDTCRLYPRHVEEYEDVREWSMSLSCPVAAEMLVNRDSAVTFSSEENDEADPLEDEFEDFDFIFFDALMMSRDTIFSILDNREMSISERACAIMEVARLTQERFDDGDLFLLEEQLAKHDFKAAKQFSLKDFAIKNVALLNELELLSEDWEKYIKTAQSVVPSEEIGFIEGVTDKEHELIIENILRMLLYTFYPGAVYNGMVYGYTGMCIFGAAIVNLIAGKLAAKASHFTKEDYARILYMYSRETEHSDDNIGAMLEWLDLK